MGKDEERSRMRGGGGSRETRRRGVEQTRGRLDMLLDEWWSFRSTRVAGQVRRPYWAVLTLQKQASATRGYLYDGKHWVNCKRRQKQPLLER